MLNMIIVGLLSTKKQANEILFIAQVCSVEIYVKSIVRNHKYREFLKREKEIFKNIKKTDKIKMKM